MKAISLLVLAVAITAFFGAIPLVIKVVVDLLNNLIYGV